MRKLKFREYLVRKRIELEAALKHFLDVETKILSLAEPSLGKSAIFWEKEDNRCNLLLLVCVGFLQYLALDITASQIWEIQCLALDWFNHSTDHKLSS